MSETGDDSVFAHRSERVGDALTNLQCRPSILSYSHPVARSLSNKELQTVINLTNLVRLTNFLCTS